MNHEVPDPFRALVACGRVVIARAAGHVAAPDELHALARDERTWCALLDLARAHAMHPLLLVEMHAMRDAGIPPVVAAAAAAMQRDVAISALAATRQLAHVVDLLSRAGVRALPYKGPLVSLQAYGSAALRVSEDLDVVVPPADLPDALAALGGAGYVLTDGRSWSQSSIVHVWQGHVAFSAPAEPLPVELHWRFCHRKLPWSPDVAGVIARAAPLHMGGAEVLAPSVADQIVLILLHAARHGWDRLESLVCAAALAARGVDGAELLVAARRARGSHPVLVGLEAARRLFAFVLPSAVVGAIAEDRRLPAHVEEALRRVRAGNAGVRRDAGLHLALLDGLVDRARYVALAGLLPTQRDLDVIRLPYFLRPMYVPVRLARLLGRTLKR